METVIGNDQKKYEFHQTKRHTFDVMNRALERTFHIYLSTFFVKVRIISFEDIKDYGRYLH